MSFFRKVLSDQSICVFIESFFPWGIRMCKEKLCIQIFSNGFMFGKFFSIIRSDGVNFYFHRYQQVDGGPLYLLRRFVRHRAIDIAGICALPEKARHPYDDRQWWYRFPSHRCVTADPPPTVVFQSKPDLGSFLCGSGYPNVFYVSSLSTSECGDHLLWTYPSKYTDRSIHGWPWFFYFFQP